MAVDTGKVVQVLGNVVDVEFTPRAAAHQRRAARRRERGFASFDGRRRDCVRKRRAHGAFRGR